MSNNTEKSCLPPGTFKKVIPFSTSKKREGITTWWTNVCNKAHQRQVTKSRGKMHKTLKKFLKQQEVVESKTPSPASASIGVINETAATSVTHVNLDDDDEGPSTAATTLRPKRRVSIGKAFDDFQNKTKFKQAEELEKYNKKQKKNKISHREQREIRQRQETLRLRTQEKNLDNYREMRLREERQQQENLRIQNLREQRRGYQPNLAPLQENDEPETSAAAAARLAPQTATQVTIEETTQATTQAVTQAKTQATMQQTTQATMQQTTQAAADNGNSNNNEPTQETNNTNGQDFLFIQERVPAPRTPSSEFDYNEYAPDFVYDEDDSAQTEEISLTPAAEFARTIRASLRLSPTSSSKTAKSHASSKSGHSTDPVADLRQSTHMNTHIENRHDGTSPPPHSPPGRTDSGGDFQQAQEQQPPGVIITANANSIILEPSNVAAQGEIVQPLQDIPMFTDLEQVNYYILHEQYRQLQQEQEDGRPQNVSRIPQRLMRNSRTRLLDLTVNLRLTHIKRLIKDFRENFTSEVYYCLHEDNRKLFKTTNHLLDYCYDGRNIIGDGMNGGVRVVYKIKDLEQDVFMSNVPEYAVKKIQVNYPNQAYKESILNEIKIMDRARGQNNLMSLTELFYENDKIVIMMDRMKCDLYNFVCSMERPLPPHIALHILCKIVKGLSYLHYDIGFFHGDIKPENVLLNADGQVKITDFGFSSPVGVSVRDKCGTLDYMAPEVYLFRNFNDKSDLWSLGITLLFMLEGELPQTEEDDFLTADFIDVYFNLKMILRNIGYIPFLMYIFRACLEFHPSERCTVWELDDYLEKYDVHLPIADASEYGRFVIDNIRYTQS